jgi:hypothetical protein
MTIIIKAMFGQDSKKLKNQVTQVVFPLKAGLPQVGTTCDTL